jgi:hypothetical protein
MKFEKGGGISFSEIIYTPVKMPNVSGENALRLLQ